MYLPEDFLTMALFRELLRRLFTEFGLIQRSNISRWESSRCSIGSSHARVFELVTPKEATPQLSQTTNDHAGKRRLLREEVQIFEC